MSLVDIDSMQYKNEHATENLTFQELAVGHIDTELMKNNN